MPFPNEHSFRLRNPDDLDPDTFRRTKGGKIYGSKKIPANVSVIWGKLKGSAKPSDPPLPQALRFPKDKYTPAQAKKWMKDNNIKYMTFEAAKNETVTSFRNRLNEIIWRTKNGRIIGIKQKDDKDFTREDKLKHYQKNMDSLNAKLFKAETDHANKKNAIRKAKENGIDEETFKKLLADELKTKEDKDWLENKLQYTQERYKKANNGT